MKDESSGVGMLHPSALSPQPSEQPLQPALPDDRNVYGRARAITVMSPIKPGWTLFLRVLLWLFQTFPRLSEPLVRLSFIHFAHWNIVTRIPENGPPQAPERLNYHYSLFLSNFNGSWDDYIDAFSRNLTLQMKLLWGSSYGFPGPQPVDRFEAYIRRNEYVTSYYWSAYPRSSTTMILDALQLEPRFRAFLRETEALGPEEFKQAYDLFLTDVQGYL
jgi:hypothetical protein